MYDIPENVHVVGRNIQQYIVYIILIHLNVFAGTINLCIQKNYTKSGSYKERKLGSTAQETLASDKVLYPDRERRRHNQFHGQAMFNKIPSFVTQQKAILYITNSFVCTLHPSFCSMSKIRNI